MSKIKFEAEFDNRELEDLVTFCGGNPKKVIKWWNEKYAAPKNLKELVLYDKGETIDFTDVPSELKTWTNNCIYDYEKGLTTSLVDSLNLFIEGDFDYLDEEDAYVELETLSRYCKPSDDYDFKTLEKHMEKFCPGIVDFLVTNKVKEIVFTW